MAAVAQHAPEVSVIRTILDLGCGTGRFSEPLQTRFDAAVVGIDPSSQMLRQARAKHDSRSQIFVQGTGESLPLKDDSVDLVFISMAFHHFTDVPAVLRECRRVLPSHGCVFLRAGTTDRIEQYPASVYFPASVPIMEAKLWSVAATCRAFEAVGFHTLHTGLVTQVVAPTHAAFVAQVAARGDSVLAELNADDFAAGLAELRSAAEKLDPQPVEESIDYLVFG